MKGILNHASIAISLILAALYALGLNFHLSFLKNLGIEETQFPLTIDRVFYQGFFVFADLTAPKIGFIIICASGVAITAYIAILFVEVAKKSNFMKPIIIWLQSKFKKGRSQTELHPALEGFSLFSTKVFWYICIGTLLYISILITLMAAEHAGKSHAEKYKEKILAGSLAVDYLLVEESKGKVIEYKGYSIICNSSQCAYYDGNNSSVFNHNTVRSLTSTPILKKIKTE